ncbi:3-ketoacyl-CoA thiolase with broad chain length specificity [Kappamyces sp. JEL0680]|nr:3-ketoacyl-CoA thiolase with broad chain length specificity [Kappamyces sp. JEL0680]
MDPFHAGAEYTSFIQSNSFQHPVIADLKGFLYKNSPEFFGVVLSFKEPVKSSKGDQDWSMNLTVADPTIPPPNRGLTILIFKPTLQECPQIQVGDIVKCCVKLSQYQDRLQGIISKSSKNGYIKLLQPGDPSMLLADASIFSALKKWYNALTANKNYKPGTTSKRTGGRPVLLLQELDSQRTSSSFWFDFYCKVLMELPSSPDARSFLITDYTVNEEHEYDAAASVLTIGTTHSASMLRRFSPWIRDT